jgi:nitrate reductase beta subunit
VCSETCVGRIRYLGVLLYDADRIQEAASVEHDRDLYHPDDNADLYPYIQRATPAGLPGRSSQGLSPR